LTDNISSATNVTCI